MEVDHIDGDRLNNRRYNLRLVTKKNNLRNSSVRKNGTSSFKGVNFLPANNRWRARITVDGKSIPLGCYHEEQQAALAYNRAAKEYFGEYARLNNVK